MTKMLDYVAEMQARLTETSCTERTLIRALGNALAEVDKELLAEVRDLTLAHEARRVAILDELQGLAARIGAFPAPRETATAVIEAEPSSVPPIEQRVGDWRQAVSNIKDDLDTFFGRDVQH